ncbi:hypothetical protein [uncultured Polaribacter sp.]|uniref:hypothetical protein n=1 Tax=uncultured Polaribacter sp. TaxID=174711 RepID=UPI00259B084E|nr:hypothetical protein [uncultured Polaribacter sp.]
MDDKEIFNDFSSILELDKKKRKNKTLGIVLISFSLVTSTLGIIELSGGKGEISDSIGGTFLGAGIISGGVSIPLFNSSRKKKKKRDRLVKKYKMTSNI